MHRITNTKISIIGVVSTLVIMGVGVYGYVIQTFGFLSIALGLLGIATLVFCIGYTLVARRKAMGGLQWKRLGAYVCLYLLLFALLIGVNYFAQQLPQRWDVSRDKQHTLTPETIDFVSKIEAPVELTAFYVGLPPKYIEDLLNEYKRVSNGKINVNIIDPIVDIASAAKFGNVISGQERKLIVTSGSERKDVDFSETTLTEEHVSNALTGVVREPRKVYFLTGHGEYSATNQNNDGLSRFADLLRSNNISSSSLMLGVENEIPLDCDVLIIAGPRSELTDHEYALIDSYLEQGGDALFLIENVVITNPETPLTADQLSKNPSLNPTLNQWGINIGTDIVVDINSHVGGDVGSPATKNYINHQAITQGLDYTFYIRPRSVSELENHRDTIKLAPITLSASKEKSWAETDRTLSVKFDNGIDIAGPVPISYVIWEPKQGQDESDTRIIVFTDADFLSNAYLDQYSNAAMGINLINWLSELDYAVFVDQTSQEVERLDLTSRQKRIIVALLFLMPLLIALAGLWVWIRRE